MSPLRASTFRSNTPSLVRSVRRFSIALVQILCILALVTGCQGTPTASPAPVVNGTSIAPVPTSQAAAYPQTEIVFEAKLPSKLADGQTLYLEFMDEVTGLALNASREPMESQDQQNFTARLPFSIGSVLKYRYVHSGDVMEIEHNSLGRQVRYRMYYVNGPGQVLDTITGWRSEPAASPLGRIQGTVADRNNNAPIVNALVTAGGRQTFSATDGSFLIEGLPAGTHNLVVYSLDGSFLPFQQGAIVAADSTTPALVLMQSSRAVNVTFLVSPPEDGLDGAPIRLVGNIYSLGNTFADLSGGVSVMASRAPLMTRQEDGRYSLTLRLPAGLDLRYKYTLGDGFWNSERTTNGNIRLRQLIVPDRDITLEETIDTWKTKGMEPVSFTVTVPDSTPPADTISIQFNPYGWTEPIPMWPLGSNRWLYVLYNPLNLFQNASYRYCRNEQCGFADAVDTAGAKAAGKPFQPSAEAQDIQDSISAWTWLDPSDEPAIVSAGEIGPKVDFMAGVEMMPVYHPSWQPYMGNAFQNIKSLGSNSVILTPTWRMTHKTPPVIEPVAGMDPLWIDLSGMAGKAQQSGLAILIHPVLRYTEDPQTWWQSAPRDEGWWQSWFDRYRTFLLYHADLATQTGARALILGDETMLPALPGGTLADGSPSGVPANADERWKRLIADVRIRYSGRLAWMVPYNGQMPALPSFLGELDYAYVQISAPVADSDDATQLDIEVKISEVLDKDLVVLRDELESPIVVALKYPSARGAFDGCVESGEGCLAPGVLNQPNAALPGELEPGLKEQADAYSALLSVINQRTWISGFFAAGYYPPAESRDLTVSIHGKPAGDVLWYWFPRLLAPAAP